MVQANNKVQIKNILKTMAPYTTGAGSTPAVFKRYTVAIRTAVRTEINCYTDFCPKRLCPGEVWHPVRRITSSPSQTLRHREQRTPRCARRLPPSVAALFLTLRDFKPNRSMKYSMHRPKIQKYIIIFRRFYHTLLWSLSYEGIRYRLSMVVLTFVRGFYV